MVGRKDGLMRFHRISPCPRCGGKVKAKWELDSVIARRGRDSGSTLFCSVAPSAASRSREVARLPETRITCNAI